MLLMFVLVLNMLEIHFHMVHYERSRKLHQYKFLSFFMHILKIQHKFHAFHALFAYLIKKIPIISLPALLKYCSSSRYILIYTYGFSSYTIDAQLVAGKLMGSLT